MKELYEYIFKRKSTRKYIMKELDAGVLTEIENFIKNITPLYKDIAVNYKLVYDTKNLLPVKAPHYILIYSEEKEGYLNNIGFMFQQLDLFFSSKGLGSVWLGMAKPKEKEDLSSEFIIAMGFGEPAENPYRQPSEFKRKPAQEVCSGNDERINAARLAPSATNSQNWFFAEIDGKIGVYQKNLNPLQNVIYGKMNHIDIGIALCHLCISTLKQDREFNFSKEPKHLEINGYKYIGTVQ